MKKQNAILLFFVIILAVMPFMLPTDGIFSGADDQLAGIVKDVNPDYEPWFKSIWEPPSGEVESFLFAVQAGLGTGFLGYFFGYYRGRKVSAREGGREFGRLDGAREK